MATITASWQMVKAIPKRALSRVSDASVVVPATGSPAVRSTVGVVVDIVVPFSKGVWLGRARARR